jgi:hypothetical protein
MLNNLLSLSAMTLSTSSPSGEPHAAPVYFVAGEGMRLYFFSEADSRHSLDLKDNPRAAIAIYPECHDWRDIRGLQLRGEVRRVPRGAEWEAAWKLYAAKFPFVSALKAVVERNTLHVFVPHWVRLVDNSRGFGFKEEWTLP